MGSALVNEPDQWTYHSHDGKFLSVLDLTFVNSRALHEDTVRGWYIDNELTCGSDHFAVRWTINQGMALVMEGRIRRGASQVIPILGGAIH